MNKREKLAFGIVAALAMTSGGIAYGQSVNNVSSDQVIYACVTGVNGNIVKVSNTRKTCPRGTTPIQWNAVGPRGEQGIPGSAVAKGDKGEAGAQGPKGDQGIQGSNGKDGVDSARFGHYLLSPDGYKHYLVQYNGLPIVENAGKYWDYAGGMSSAMTTASSDRWDLEFYEEEGCVGDWYLATRTYQSYPINIAFASPVDEYVRNQTFGTSPMKGYSLVPDSAQNAEKFKSFRVGEYSQGIPQGVCIAVSPEELEYRGGTLESGYFYKATLIGTSPDLSASQGYTVHIG